MYEWRMQLYSLYRELLLADQQAKLDLLREVERHFPKEIHAELPRVIVLKFKNLYEGTLIEETLQQIGYIVDHHIVGGVVATLSQ